jgi:predicted HNH restriction endonuclease
MGREPDVHHITPVRDFDEPQNAHTLDNVICLCRSCHRLAEIGKVPHPDPQETESDT